MNEQNKVLPGAYINIRTNEPLSITLGERGTVMLLQEMSNAEEGKIYQMTASQTDFPEAVTADEKKLVKEALKNAKTVLIYVLPAGHTAAIMLVRYTNPAILSLVGLFPLLYHFHNCLALWLYRAFILVMGFSPCR